MTREEAKKVLPIIKAFSEGKEIEGIYKGIKSPWFKVENMVFDGGTDYRIKPEPTYRPFKDGAECWNEMQKHEPFGWVKIKNDPTNTTVRIAEVNDTYMFLSGSYSDESIDYEEAFEKLTFLDGTPFGKKEE